MEIFFSEWLQKELDQREWTQADLARATGLTPQAINAYLKQRRTNPDPQALAAIANAFGYTVEAVYKAAGVPYTPDPDPLLREWLHILEQLTPEDVTRLHVIAQSFIATYKIFNKRK